ncbi:MAG: TraR/DksA family transcriptional regulator [Deltaproteobacteria bacterium]|nr:TraR/DksA family transcriptional regulator [Deltaproteobacteria bacterium]
MTIRKEKVAHIKNDLLARRNTLASELRKSHAELINDEEFLFSDSVDQASADTGKSLVVQIKNRNHIVLAEIDQALKRIELGIFGECERCGDEISEARMKAYPSTTLCIQCKTETEAEALRYPKKI